jgi:hypothetical protein
MAITEVSANSGPDGKTGQSIMLNRTIRFPRRQ